MSVVNNGQSHCLIELGGLTPGIEHDQLNVAGELSLSGALNDSLLPGFNPPSGQSFDILDWGNRSGTFSSINLPTLSEFVWDTSQLYATGVLSVAAPGLAGDFNVDGSVDAADYVAWRKNAGGIYTQAHYGEWRVNFGATAGGGIGLEAALSSTSVPEPATLTLAAFVATLLVVRRQRNRIAIRNSPI